MAAAVFAVAATIGAEAIGFALAEAAVWSWSTVLAKSAYSAVVSLAVEPSQAPPELRGAYEHR